jgi:hypothetical protein
MKIKIKKVLFMGYLQGFKIYINNVKYPRKRKFFYTAMNKEKALFNCLKFDYIRPQGQQ